MTREPIDLAQARAKRQAKPDLDMMAGRMMATVYKAVQRASVECVGNPLDDAHAEAIVFEVLQTLAEHYAQLAASEPEASA